MGKKIAGMALAASVAVGGGIVLSQPAEAQQDREDRMAQREQRREERMAQREERQAQREAQLQSRVDDGSITQERADEIRAHWAERMAQREERREARAAQREERRAAKAEHREALATTLGTTVEELRADLQAGMSLADIAEAAGVDVNVIIDQIVDHKTERINDRVENGGLSQERADERLADLRDRVTAKVIG